MSLVTVIIALVLVGVILWLIDAYIPMNPTIKKLLMAIVIIIVVLWLLQGFGLLGAANDIQVKPIR
jgi:hypothetical protein